MRSARAREATTEPVAARVGDEVITVAELDEQIKEDLWKRETGDGNPSRALRAAHRQRVKSLVAQRALDAEAKKRGLTTEAMLEAEFKKLPPVDDAAVKAFYDQNAAQMQRRAARDDRAAHPLPSRERGEAQGGRGDHREEPRRRSSWCARASR